MTRDEIIALAEQSGIDCDTDGDIWGSTNGALLKFAALVAAAEREACAKIANKQGTSSGQRIAEKIRERGNK